MCGIAGVIGFDASCSAEMVEAMLSTIEHRGPDDKGKWVSDGIGLGMQRLSIIDLSDGHQPMIGEKGNVLVFNGEIYNFRDLRQELIRLGATFATRSDTEVILRGYEVWGIQVVERLVGMFAIALFDSQKNELHLVRDRLGKKPLYYGLLAEGRGFGFASELKALRHVLGKNDVQIDTQAVYDYLSFRFVPQPRTIWSGFHKLPPGHRLVINIESMELNLSSYWKVEVNADPSVMKNSPVIQEQFNELFLEAVKLRLEASDVPVGVLLSGGLDSSAVVAAASELGHQAIQTFSIGFSEGGDFSELDHARIVARHFGTEHREVVMSKEDFLTQLPLFAAISDEPLGDLASIPLHSVCGLAARNVKVALSGEGADEVLAGYDFGKMAQSLNRIKWAHELPSFIREGMGRILKSTWADNIFQGNLGDVPMNRKIFISRDWDSQNLEDLWVGPSGMLTADARINEWYESAQSPDPLSKILQVYLGDWLVEDLLMKADKMSMANSLELRTPFLDHRLVEFVARLPNSYKVGGIRKWTTKRLLREFAVSRVPEQIVNRPKLGFPVPAYGWLQSGLSPWARERLMDNTVLANFCDRAAMEDTVKLASEGHRSAQRRTWNLLVLDHWLEAWV